MVRGVFRDSSSLSSPFGASSYHAFPGLIFEALPSGEVASLTIFSVAPEELLPAFVLGGSS